MEPKPLSELPPPQPLPIISEETRQSLFEELGLDNSPDTQRIITGITGERVTPVDRIHSLAEIVFGDLIMSNRGLAQTISDELSLREPYKQVKFITRRRELGMAIVLKAFHIQSGFNLVPNFGKLQGEDLNLVRQIIQTSIPSDSDTDSLPILERLLSMPRIPEQQFVLNEIIQKTRKVLATNNIYAQEGANTMYAILSHLWPKLGPETPSTQPPNVSFTL